MLNPEIINELKNREQEQKNDRKKFFTKDTKLQVVLQSLKQVHESIERTTIFKTSENIKTSSLNSLVLHLTDKIVLKRGGASLKS